MKLLPKHPFSRGSYFGAGFGLLTSLAFYSGIWAVSWIAISALLFGGAFWIKAKLKEKNK